MEKTKVFDLMIYTENIEGFLIKLFELNGIKWDYDIKKQLAIDYYDINLFQVVKLKELYKNRFLIYIDDITQIEL